MADVVVDEMRDSTARVTCVLALRRAVHASHKRLSWLRNSLYFLKRASRSSSHTRSFLSRPFVCFRNESFRCVCPCRIMGSFVASSSILSSCRAQADTRQSLLGPLRPCCLCLCCAVPLGFTEGIWSSVCSASCLAPISFANAVVHRAGTCLIRCPPFEAFRQRPARTW